MKKFLIIFIPILLLAGSIGGYIYWYYLPIHKIERAFEMEDYTVVVDLYGELSGTEEKKYVQGELAKVAGDLYRDYLAEKISFDKAMEYFDLVKRVLKKNSKVAEQREAMEEICRSRILFSEGMGFMDQRKYLEAIQCFQDVSGLDTKYRKEADERILACRNEYCEGVLSQARELMTAQSYEEAQVLVLSALEYFPGEPSLEDRLKEIRDYLEEMRRRQEELEQELQEKQAAKIEGTWSTEYNLGGLIAEELGVYDYSLCFPVELVFSFCEGTMGIYVSKDSIRPALDALTADPNSMEAIYRVAENYGIKKATADLLIKLTYGGSYSDFIMDYFGKEIDDALKEFSLSTAYYSDGTRIFVGTECENEDHYISITVSEKSMALEEYVGERVPLSWLQYPILLEREDVPEEQK